MELDTTDQELYGSRIVITLMRDFLDKGYAVTMDRYFSSVSLVDYLLTRKTYAIGTIESKRKGFPKSLVDTTDEKGDYSYKMKSNGVSINFTIFACCQSS